MKTTIESLAPVILGIGLLVVGCSKKQTATFQPLKVPEVAAQLKSFVAEKESQARAAATAGGQDLPPEFDSFFAAAAKNDWPTATNGYAKIKKRVMGDNRLRGSCWQATMETFGAIEQTTLGDQKYAAAFGNDIIKSIPAGSIYFGGTDPGRFLVTALSESHADGKPFFTLTQNALADMTYLDYLRSMYGGKIYIPTAEDSQKSFQDYTEDVARRQQNHQLSPGENVKVTEGRVQVSGVGAVMQINGLLVKTIFEKNPDREFYIEESYPLDWMYPNLEPHGLIFKINRQPLPELSGEIVQRDHDYWTKYIQPMIGDWLNEGTPVETVTTFSEKVFLRHDLAGFTGDPQFIQNEYSFKMFSKLRSSIASLYVWRMNQASTAEEKERMAHEADFAFRQALALCPYSPETVGRYGDFLKSRNRPADAALVSEMAKQFPKQN